MEEVEEVVDSSAICSTSSNTPGPGLGQEQSIDLVKCVNCNVSVDKSSSSWSWYNPNGDSMKVENFKRRILHKELPFSSIICSNCQLLKDKPNSDGLGQECQGQAEKMIIDDDEEVEGNCGGEVNPFEIDNIVEIILNNMKKVDDLKNSRLINNTWNKYAVKVLSTPSIQSQLKPKPFTCPISEYNDALKNTVQLFKNSENKKIFTKFQFWFQCGDRDPPYFDDENYTQIFEIIDMTHPTHIIFYADDHSKNFDVNLFVQFLHKISQYIVRLKIRLCIAKEKLVVEGKSLEFEFPNLKTLEIEALDKETHKFMKMLLKNCHFLNDLKVHGDTDSWDNESIIDHYLPGLLTPEIVQNLQKLHLKGTAFTFDFSNQDVKSKMNLKSLKVDPIEIYPETFSEAFIDFSELKSFLTSQEESLEKFTIHFHFLKYENNSQESEESMGFDDHQNESFEALDIPLLENLSTLKLKYDWFFFNNRTKYWPVKPINLPEILPNLRKIEISYDTRWTMSFMADNPCETVEELVLEKWSKGNVFMFNLVVLFPKIKYLKVNFGDYRQEDLIQPNLRSMGGWSSTLEKIDVQFQSNFPQNFDFRGFSSLSNLSHLHLHQKTKNQDQIPIQPDFTPLFNMKKLSNLVIENVKISEDIIEKLFEKFPKLDYTI